jgi:NADH:ubiquinone reductase (H+-translocating)
MHSKTPHIVVIGAGFGGLNFCKSFPAGLARITLIDRQNHHLFQPLLYQVATAGLSATEIAQPIRAILAKQPDLKVLMAEVTGFDLAGKQVLTATGPITFDYLVLALGGVTSYFGHDEWAQYAPGLKSLDDALKIRRQILMAFEKAETETDPARVKQLMTTVVVGGGPTGVEMAGAVAELARTVLQKDFDHIDPTRARVILIEGSNCVLGTFPRELSEKARIQLEELGVEIRTGTRVQEIRHGEVVLPNEVIEAGNIIWAAGVSANPLTKLLGVELDRAGRVKIAPDLSLPGHPNVFAIGDMAALTDVNGVVVPGVSPAAIQMGRHVANQIAGELRAQHIPGATVPPRTGFAYHDKGTMATIGRSRAIAVVGKWRFSGFLAWLAWLLVHVLFLIGFRNKVSVVFQWAYSYFTYKRGARIITGLSGEQSAGSA